MKKSRTYGSNIPLARDLLEQISKDISGAVVSGDMVAARVRAVIADHMHQTRPDKVTRVRNPAPTRDQCHAVRYLRRITDMSQQDIAEAVGLNIGRVSEILHGAWD